MQGWVASQGDHVSGRIKVRVMFISTILANDAAGTVPRSCWQKLVANAAGGPGPGHRAAESAERVLTGHPRLVSDWRVFNALAVLVWQAD